jgi:hypothetical protein
VKPLAGWACAELAQWGRPWCSYRTALLGSRRLQAARGDEEKKKEATYLPTYIFLRFFEIFQVWF